MSWKMIKKHVEEESEKRKEKIKFPLVKGKRGERNKP